MRIRKEPFGYGFVHAASVGKEVQRGDVEKETTRTSSGIGGVMASLAAVD